MTDVDGNLVVDELNLLVTEPMPAHPLVDVIPGLGKHRGCIIIKRPCTAQPRETGLDRPELCRECRARKRELLIEARHTRVKTAEGFDDFLEFTGRYLVILCLNVLTPRVTVLDVPDIDIT